MTKTKRWMVVLGAVAIAGSLWGGAALAEKAPGAPATKEYTKPAPSAGNVELQKALEDGYKAHMEQWRTEALAMIDQAVKDGKVSEKEAAGYRRKYEAPAAPPSREELKAQLDEMVRLGKITQEHADKKLAGFDQEQAKKK